MQFFKQRWQNILIVIVLIILFLGSLFFSFIRTIPWIAVISLPFSIPKISTNAAVIQQLNANIHSLPKYPGGYFCPLETINSIFGITIYHNGQVVIQADVHGTGCREIDLHVLDGKTTAGMRLTNDNFWILLQKFGVSNSQFYKNY